jgi:hypothetical protein
MRSVAVALGIHPLPRPGAPISASAPPITGSFLARCGRPVQCVRADRRSDGLLGHLRSLVALSGFIIAQLSAVITLRGGSVALAGRAIPAIGRLIPAGAFIAGHDRAPQVRKAVVVDSRYPAADAKALRDPIFIRPGRRWPDRTRR